MGIHFRSNGKQTAPPLINLSVSQSQIMLSSPRIDNLHLLLDLSNELDLFCNWKQTATDFTLFKWWTGPLSIAVHGRGCLSMHFMIFWGRLSHILVKKTIAAGSLLPGVLLLYPLKCLGPISSEPHCAAPHQAQNQPLATPLGDAQCLGSLVWTQPKVKHKVMSVTMIYMYLCIIQMHHKSYTTQIHHYCGCLIPHHYSKEAKHELQNLECLLYYHTNETILPILNADYITVDILCARCTTPPSATTKQLQLTVIVWNMRAIA